MLPQVYLHCLLINSFLQTDTALLLIDKAAVFNNLRYDQTKIAESV